MSRMLPLRIFNWRNFTRRIVVAAIKGQRDPAIRKEWIMTAFCDGHLTADEAEDLIVLGGLVSV